MSSGYERGRANRPECANDCGRVVGRWMAKGELLLPEDGICTRCRRGDHGSRGHVLPQTREKLDGGRRPFAGVDRRAMLAQLREVD